MICAQKEYISFLNCLLLGKEGSEDEHVTLLSYAKILNKKYDLVNDACENLLFDKDWIISNDQELLSKHMLAQ